MLHFTRCVKKTGRPYLHSPESQTEVLTWHVGEAKPRPMGADPTSTAPKDVFSDIVEVQAEGDELNHIVHFFPNLPRSLTPVVVWKAPWAQFIYDNMPAR